MPKCDMLYFLIQLNDELMISAQYVRYKLWSVCGWLLQTLRSPEERHKRM